MTNNKPIKQLASMILEACKSPDGIDATMVRAGHLLADLLCEVEIQAQAEPGGYDTGWLEIISDYCADRLNSGR